MNQTKIFTTSLALFVSCLISRSQSTEVHSFTNLHRVVPDGNAAGLSDRHMVTSSIVNLSQVQVKLNLNGEFNGDLYGYLRHIHSSGTNFCVLLNRVGRTATNGTGYPDAGFDVMFDNSAANGDIHLYRQVLTPAPGTPLTGVWQPDGRNVDPWTVTELSPRTTTLASFGGVAAGGEWTLFLADLDRGGSNVLAGWELELTGRIVPSISWPTPAGIVYGTALSSTQLNATSLVTGTFDYDPPAGTILNAENAQSLSVIFRPGDTNAYVSVTNHVSLDVLRKGLTISANSTNKVYGAADPAFGVSYSGFVNGEDSGALGGALVISRQPGESVGSYAVSPSGLSSANYAITFADGSLTITPALLAVAAAHQTKVYGTADPLLSYSVSGLQLGDTSGAVLSGALARAPGETVPGGPYPITQGTLSANANYSINFTGNTLSITPAILNAKADDKARLYGQTNPVFSISYLGFVNGDSVASLDIEPAAGSLAVINSPVGAYPITLSGGSDDNYTFNFMEGTLSITPASSVGLLTSSANPAVPGSSVSFTCTLSGVPPGAGPPTGVVQFKVDGINTGSPVSLSGGVAVYTTATLTVGLHSVKAEYAGSLNFFGTTNSLAPAQLINTPPVAGADTIERSPSSGTKVSVATLLANDTDADGDLLTFVGFSTNSAQGGSLSESNGWLIYAPPPGFTNGDSFTYTISDGRGAPVSGTVTINVQVDTTPSPNLEITSLGNGSYLIRFDGIPGTTYRIEYVETLEGPMWQTLANGTADEAGMFEYVDTPPIGSPTRYYRSAYP